MNKILYIVLLLFVCITAKRHHKEQQCIFRYCENQLLGCFNDRVCRAELSACNKKYGYAVAPSDFSECSSDDKLLFLWFCITSYCNSPQMNNDKN